jgi:hypothetical protein
MNEGSLRHVAAAGGSLKLPNVALCAASSIALPQIALPQTIRALEISSKYIDFGESLLFSDNFYELSSSEIECRNIQKMRSIMDYSAFILRDLRNHIQTSHVLIIQWDGYVLDPTGWTDEFLDFDYIGAPWPQFKDAFVVGNGGFSLRSRRLLDACAHVLGEGKGGQAEDLLICRDSRLVLERDFGIRFAPQSLADRFSFERTPRKGHVFGFHGVFNMPDIMGEEAFICFYKELPQDALSPRSRAEVAKLLASRPSGLFDSGNEQNGMNWRALISKIKRMMR